MAKECNHPTTTGLSPNPSTSSRRGTPPVAAHVVSSPRVGSGRSSSIATTSHPTRHSVRLPVAVAWCYTATRTRFSARWNGRATRPSRASPRSPFSNTATSSPSTGGARAAGVTRDDAPSAARENTRRRRRPRARARRGRTQGELQTVPRRVRRYHASLSVEDVRERWRKRPRDAVRCRREVTGSNPAQRRHRRRPRSIRA